MRQTTNGGFVNKTGLTEGEQTTNGEREPSWITKKIEDSPKGRKTLLRQTTRMEMNYFWNFIDEIKALSIFGEKKKGGLVLRPKGN